MQRKTEARWPGGFSFPVELLVDKALPSRSEPSEPGRTPDALGYQLLSRKRISLLVKSQRTDKIM